MRFILTLLGLEHTGHHLWHSHSSILETLTKSGFTTRADNLATVNFFNELHHPVGDPDTFSANLTGDYASAIVKDTEHVPPHHFGYLSVTSYPGGGHEACMEHTKRCVYPLPFAIQAAAGRVGVPSKFILLTRPALEVVRDNFWPNEGFTNTRVDVLNEMCTILEKHLASLKRRSVFCAPYKDYNMPGFRKNLGKFLGIDLNSVIDAVYKPSSVTRKRALLRNKTATLHTIRGVSSLQKCIDRIEYKGCSNRGA